MTETPVEPTVEVRPKRICDVCGGFDDHPRHVIAHPVGQAPQADDAVAQRLFANLDMSTEEGRAAVKDFYDTTIQLRHMDCCRDSGCPDGTCEIVTAGAEGLTGPDLLAHIQETQAQGTYYIDGRPEAEVLAELPQTEA